MWRVFKKGEKTNQKQEESIEEGRDRRDNDGLREGLETERERQMQRKAKHLSEFSKSPCTVSKRLFGEEECVAQKRRKERKFEKRREDVRPSPQTRCVYEEKTNELRDVK